MFISRKIVQFVLTLSEMCKCNYEFIIQVTVKGAVELDYITLRGVFNILASLFTYMRGAEY